MDHDLAMLDHLSIQCADVTKSAAFYDTVLAPLGGKRILDFTEVIGYGVPPMPDFWLGPRSTGEGFRESHIAFTAARPSRRAGVLRRRRGHRRGGAARATGLPGVSRHVLRRVRAGP